jgi:hypothetical protein
MSRPGIPAVHGEEDVNTFTPGTAGMAAVSGDVEGQRQLIRRTYLGEQDFERLAQVGDRGFLGRAIAGRADARAELGRGAPDAVLVLLDGVGHMNNARHEIPLSHTTAGDAPTWQR